MFKRNNGQQGLTSIETAPALYKSDSASTTYTSPIVYELGTLAKVQAYHMIGYPDGWRGYYSRS